MSRLVTGAAGFIGSHLAETLLERGHAVVGVDAFLDNYPRSRKESHLERLRDDAGFRLVEGRLQELDLVELLSSVERVYHLAALPGVRPSWGVAFEEYLAHNVLATQRLLEAAREVGLARFVYASSSSVYGDVEELPMAEAVRERPYSPYGVTKLGGEQMVRLYARNYGLHGSSVRYFTVYGPRQRPDMAIQKFLVAAREGGEIPVYGDGEQTRDFTYVADAVEATVRAGEHGAAGGVYNVGGGSTVTVNQLVKVIETVSGAALRVAREPSKPGDVPHTRADCRRARSTLGFVPDTPLAEGIRRQWEWLLESPETDR